MESPSSKLPVLRARIACVSCRRGKRRCDRALPSCDVCTRQDIQCSYPTLRRQKNGLALAGLPYWTKEQALVSRSQELDGNFTRLSVLSETAIAISFIAPRVFREAQLGLPQPNPPIPNEVAAHIGDVSNIHSIVRPFFSTIHIWMPIISKKRFATMLNPLSHRPSELSLLVLCMKLCCTPPPEDRKDGRTPLYRAAKRFHYDVEAAGVLSIRILQAGLLIALYELGHAIYPAAYLTVGACARYGMALGIDRFGLELMGDTERTAPWLEIEEMRRVWWAVLILDR